MDIISILLVSLGLAADAFSVSICKGLNAKKSSIKNSLFVGFMFGLFQMLMPFIGYYLGSAFSSFIENIDHYIAFILLTYIGINMILEAFKKEDALDNNFSFKSIFILSIATSIDALSYGVVYSLSYGSKNVLLCFSMIGIITFILSFIGCYIGNKLGEKFKKTSRILGGNVLIILGIKILIEHLFL